MKASTLVVPILIASLIFLGVWALGILAVKSSATATRTSAELLRLHLEVTRLHHELAVHSRFHLQEDLGALPTVPHEAPDELPEETPPREEP